MLLLRFTLALLTVLGLLVAGPGTTSGMERADRPSCPVAPCSAAGADDPFTTTWFRDDF